MSINEGFIITLTTSIWKLIFFNEDLLITVNFANLYEECPEDHTGRVGFKQLQW
jgi:hypothetical protein